MSKVYFSPAAKGERLKALEKLYEKVAKDFDVRGKRVALKLHFGEKGNKTHLDPAFARKICELVRSRGGTPELVECNTLYRGERLKTEKHIKLAQAHGFDFAPVVICDTIKDWEIPVKGKHFRKVKVGGLLKKYNLMISLAHAKGHVAAGYGGALKNVGMGLGSRAGKLEMHAKIRPVFNHKKCRACGLCVRNCPAEAISLDEYAVMDSAKCIGCATCIAVCPYGAVEIPWSNTTAQEIQERIVEYAWGVTSRIKTIYFNFLLNITPHCDCVADSGKPMVKDIGILASGDVAAIEQASIDMIIKKAGRDVFREANKIDVSVQPAYAEALGMGQRRYEIVRP
jgi:hypothetical protein